MAKSRKGGVDLVVLGGSSGSVESLQRLTAALPPDFPAAVLIVLHSGARSILPQLLNARSLLRAAFAVDGEPIVSGRIYVAPPDRHMVVEGPRLRLTRGPKESGFRPAVDPLFRSAARERGARVVGVILSGSLDCGAAGLAVIKSQGGTAIVQNPAEAAYPDMPLAAISAAKPDHVLRLAEIGAQLAVLAGRPAPRAPHRPVPPLPTGGAGITCPECHGALAENPDGSFTCHVGHQFSLAGLCAEQGRDLEAALWMGVRALRENEAVALKLGAGSGPFASGQRERAQGLARGAKLITDLILSPALDAPTPRKRGGRRVAVRARRRGEGRTVR